MNPLLQYRGYFGSIEASAEDDCLYGKAQFVWALISYEGQTVSQLIAAFHTAVDDYLETCVNLKVAPEVSCKGSFNVRIGHELHLAASIAANRQSITLNDLTKQALASYLHQESAIRAG